ncbi:sensor histidine kinase [Sphingomonas lenta]|uniref:Signal transduction histidine kinase LytS n=1 Tax=Sphingomonas lenta TaxID=1141887 RepID=A0A2A2SGS2_9SPHN|nr:histidine kinase [Sphingomonas lenta]PAX08415.1 signal transduction histidine kinase LytS [Sphingomonas lenta]
MRLNSETRQAAWLTVATWALSGTLYLIPYRLFQGGPGAYVALSVTNICTMGAILSAGVYFAVRRVRRLSAPARLATLAGAVMAASAVLALYDAGTSVVLRDLIDHSAKPASFGMRATTNFVALVWQFALLGAAFTVLEANNLGRARERELAEAREAAAQAEAAASAARLAALRYQLNPHFLFNTLNAVSSLVVTRRTAEADEMLSKLSGFLRATLAADPEGLTSVEDELATLQHYLEIEAVRFDDRLAVEFSCPPDLNDALLPSFLLQPLVENAIKYAVAPANRPVMVRVEVARDADDLLLMVEDDGDGAAEVKPGTGVGLANIRQRLAVLYGARGSLEAVRRERGFLAIVRLPLQRRVASLARVA